MKFNKLILVGALVVLNSSVFVAAVGNKDYKGKPIDSPWMNMLNNVFVKFPTTTLRMAMAADRGQVVVNHIEKLKALRVLEDGKRMVLGISKKSGEVTYLETVDQVNEYVKKQVGKVIEASESEYIKMELDFVLAPVEKFMEDIKEQRAIVKSLLEFCLGVEKAKNSFICKSLDVEGSFLVYFSKTIKTVPQLNEAATEFLIFFADVNASLSDPAKEAYNKLLEKITANKKQATNK